MMKTTSLFTVLLVCFFNITKAQELAIKDKAEILYKSELLVQEFQGLLNMISNDGLTLTETETLIKNSYDPNANRIFQDIEITLEDDINPNNINNENVVDASVEKYLKDFDLFYTKSPDFTVSFTDFQISKVYQNDINYVRVYFKREFASKHNTVDIPYQSVERVADIQAVKNGNQWEAFIIGITFYDPENPLEFEAIPEDTGVVGTSEDNPAKVEILADNSEIEAMRKQNMEDFLKEQKNLFDLAIAKADQAFEKEDYQTALDAYNEAKDIDPYKVYPSQRANEIVRLLTSGKYNREELYEEAKFNGDNALKAREYERAKNFYLDALKQKPNVTWIEEKIRQIDNTIRAKANLDSKYFAGDYKNAINDYKKVIKAEKDNPEYYLGRGKCFLAMGNRKKAIKDFAAAIALDVNYIDALATRAAFFIEEAEMQVDDNFYYKAIEDYAVILGIEGADTKYNTLQAEVKLKLSNPDGAISDLSTALVKNQKDAKLLTSRGAIHVMKKNYSKAMQDFDAAIAANPDYPVAYFQRGALNVKMDRIEKAQEDFFRARKRGLKDGELKKIKEITLEFFNQGIAAFTNQNFEQAKLYLDKALTIDPYFSEGWYQLGKLQASQLNRDLAIRNYNKAILYDDKYGDAYFERATMKLLTDDAIGAVADYEKTNELLPGKLEALIGMGDAYMALDEYNNATLAFNRAYKRSGNDPEIMNRLAFSLYKSQSYKDALALFNDAIKINKDFAEAYFKRGMTFAATKDLKNAIKDFDKAVDLGYEAKLANFEIGNAYQLQGDHKKAVKYYSEVITMDATYFNAHLERAESHRALNNFNDAIGDLLEAANINADIANTDYYTTLGMLHLDLELNDDATEYFNKALSLDNSNAEAIYGMACTYSQNMNISEALTWFKRAFETRKISDEKIKTDKNSYLKNVKGEKQFKNLVKVYIKK